MRTMITTGAGGGLSASEEAGSGVLLYNPMLRATTTRMAPMVGPKAMRGEAGETMKAGKAPMVGLMQEAEAGGK